MEKIRGNKSSFEYTCEPAFEHDVQKRVLAVDKPRTPLVIDCKTALNEMLDEVIPWICDATEQDLI